MTFRDAKGKLVKAHVFPRSTFSIFQYLGRIVAAGEAGKIKLKTPQAVGPAPLGTTRSSPSQRWRWPLRPQRRRLGVKAATASCRSTMAAAATACPTSALNTKRILGLLAQLLALNTSVQDVGITQQVQLLPQ